MTTLVLALAFLAQSGPPAREADAARAASRARSAIAGGKPELAAAEWRRALPYHERRAREARAEAAEVLRRAPNFTISGFRPFSGSSSPQDEKHLFEGLRNAVPE